MKVRTFLWFDDQALEAATYYCSIFERAKLGDIARVGDKAMTVSFEIEGQHFVALNGGPTYKLTPAISLFVSCKDQREIDTYWAKLIADGGKPSRCGWLVDRFGLSWQIIPDELPALIRNPRGMEAMMGMEKIDIMKLRSAATS